MASMNMKQLQVKLGLPESLKLTRKAEELQRLSRVHFNSSVFGVGEVCKAVLCFELACIALHIAFDRSRAIRCSGLSEKAYIRASTAMQNALNLRKKLDVRELAVQFGCVRLIKTTPEVLSLYQSRFVAALPEARRASADFNRPIFTAVAFFLCARKNRLKVDKLKLIELCGTSGAEFSNVCASMMDLCFDTLGTQKVKKEVKSAKGLLDALPGKRKSPSDDSESDVDDEMDKENIDVVPGLKRSKKSIKDAEYEDWKSALLTAREAVKRSVQATGEPLKPKTPGLQTSICKYVNVASQQ
ncbi:hypothetical protein R1sor_025230 [Riccia sorocarpa]|uniref:Origin recognition complex subunit 6 n=1 Tax=Riccia sorocarpa TaxID=122646 RepID=A0ABD3G9J2_9MARC